MDSLCGMQGLLGCIIGIFLGPWVVLTKLIIDFEDDDKVDVLLSGDIDNNN